MTIPAATVWTVGALAAAVKQLVEGGFGHVWVRGELSAFKAAAAGHWYFTLGDAESQLPCAMWRTYVQRAGNRPADGTEVFALAAPSFWEEKGQFRLSVVRLLPTAAVGAGALEFERTREALARDGLLDATRKRRLPAFALRVAVVTSLDGAALHDIITVASKRWPGAELLVVGARVQGETAERELVRALQLVNRLERLDLCIVGRGGGPREDLSAFNAERVCRALAAVRVPTVSAVGHETDVTLCDLVADARAATPSAAAELAFADKMALQRELAATSVRLASGLTRRTAVAGARLERTADRLAGAVRSRMVQVRGRVEQASAQLDALSPLRVLGRGFSVALSEAGTILRSRADFATGLGFTLRVVDGSVRARVE